MNKKPAINKRPSIKQLSDCIHVLSICLAQHKDNNFDISLTEALSIIMSDANPTENKQLIQKADDIYKEALELVKTYMTPIQDPTLLQEHRSQPRLNVSSLIKISSLSNNKEWLGSLSNISWGGARIRSKTALGKDEDSLKLLLPYPDAEDIEILATIIRSWKSVEMHYTSVRFSILHQQDESKLDDLLQLLLSAKDEKHRQHTRLAHRIDITYWDIEELKSTLEDISKGGMMITMPAPVEINKSIQVQLDGTDESYSLHLRAQVIRQDRVKISGINMYQMALKFEHPTDELHTMVNTLMQNIIKQGEK